MAVLTVIVAAVSQALLCSVYCFLYCCGLGAVKLQSSQLPLACAAGAMSRVRPLGSGALFCSHHGCLVCS